MSNNFVKIDQALKNLMIKLGYSNLIEKFELIKIFEEVVGNPVLEFVKMIDFEKGILTIEIENSAMKNEVFYLREDIRNRINQSLKREAVKQIRIL